MGDYDTADLAEEMVPPEREFVGFAQGVLRAWNPETFENVVDVHGTQLEDLPVASGVEALTYVPGDTVMLTRWKPGRGRGAASYWIGMGGRVVFPAEGQGAAAIAFMTTTLARTIVDELVEELLVSPAGQELAAFVLGQRLHSASVTGSVTSLGTGYGGGGQGPVVSNVSISSARRALVQVSCGITVVAAVGQSSGQGWMSFAVSGASTIIAADFKSENHFQSGSSDQLDGSAIRATSTVLLTAADGLNAGINTFTAQYRRDFGDGTVTIFDRNLTVFAF